MMCREWRITQTNYYDNNRNKERTTRGRVVQDHPRSSWSIAAKAKSYHPLAGKCGLCTKEKTLIAANMDDNKCLNIRNELMAKCRHRRRWLLSSVPDDLG